MGRLKTVQTNGRWMEETSCEYPRASVMLWKFDQYMRGREGAVLISVAVYKTPFDVLGPSPNTRIPTGCLTYCASIGSSISVMPTICASTGGGCRSPCTIMMHCNRPTINQSREILHSASRPSVRVDVHESTVLASRRVRWIYCTVEPPD